MIKKFIGCLAFSSMAIIGLGLPVFAETSGSASVNYSVNESLSIALGAEAINFSTVNSDLMTNNMAVTGFTNSPAGYTISFNVNDHTELKHTNTNVNAGVSTLSEVTTAASFPLNKWGYAVSLATISSEITNETTFNPVTTDPTNIFLTSTNGEAMHIFTTGVKVDSSLPAGSYTNELLFTIVGNVLEEPTPPGTQGGSINEPGGSNAGHVYPANSLERAYEIAYVNAGKPMYIEDSSAAIGWRPMTDTDDVTGKQVRFAIQDISLMFEEGDYTKNVCDWATNNTNAQVVDLRDGTSYLIGKLADSRCWLLDNLALDTTNSSVQANLSSTNTNASDEAIANYINGGNTGAHDGWTTVAVAPFASTASVYDQPRINATYKGTIPQGLDPLAATVLENGWKVGVYYNYCAATAGTFCYTQGGGVDRDPNSAIDAEYDICPAGWRLPTGGAISTTGTTAGGGEFQALLTAITGETSYAVRSDPNYTLFRTAFRIPLPGWNVSAQAQGSRGRFWSSTYFDRLYRMVDMDRTTITVQLSTNSDVGVSVRCIAKKSN